MKTLPEGLATHLATGATTLCWCWRLTRRDGTVLGFTDHDRDLDFDATTFEAAAGFSASDITDAVGLGVANLEVESALASGRLEERDLAAGLYDDAGVEIYRVNWQDTSQRILMRSGTLGEVRRSGTAFTAEVRGLAHYLNQPRGRLFQYTCDADVGDHRCTIDLSAPAFSATAAIAEVTSPRRFLASGLAAYADQWFTRGLLHFSSGANAGQAIEIKAHRLVGSVPAIELWQEPSEPIAVGDTFEVTAGCDKHFETCRAKFANAENFRGFPHMPGNDFITRIARSGAGTA